MILISITIYLFILFFLLIKQKSTKIKLIFFISGILTLSICLMGLIISLPFTGADTITFELIAWQWSQGTLSDIFSKINISGSYLISSITAFFYYFLGREPIIPIIINGILGLFIMHYSMKIFDEVWKNDDKNKILFFILVAFSPMLTINSAIILRENYITLFLLIATYYLARFANTKNTVFAIFFIVFTLFSSFFHGGTILYALGLPIYLFFSKGNISNSTKFIWMALFFVVLAFILNYMDFGKLKQIQDTGLSAEFIAEKLGSIQEANSSYLQGLIPNNVIDILWQSPIRAFFFLTKPFIWDIRSFGHIIAFVDALIWIFIIFIIYKNRSAIYENPAAIAILVSCIIAIFVFSYGTSNFGTAIRHRTKFYVEMLILAAPFFIKFKFKGNKN